MKLKQPGGNTSKVELTNVSPTGIWLLIGEREFFLPFKDFPWFQDASIRELANIEMPGPHHLYWPSLDIDLAVESIEHPEKYPLISRARPTQKNIPAEPDSDGVRPVYKRSDFGKMVRGKYFNKLTPPPTVKEPQKKPRRRS
jgi:hypothetical protein